MNSNEQNGPETRPAPPVALPAAVRSALVASAPLRARVITSFSRTGPIITYQFNRIGRAGAAGAALLLAAVVFFFSALLPQYSQLSDLSHQIEMARRGGGAAESAPVRLNRFMSALPQRSQLPTVVGQVFTLAAAAHVTLERGRYELTPMRNGNLAQYRMTFPVKGHYPDIRKFIDAVLTTVPSAAVDGLRIERKAVGEENVSADLRFSLFVRSDSR